MSYKSEDVAVARAIADGLIAAGVRVWFAEYEVLLSRRAEFQDSIEQGATHSKFGLIFTNDRYVGSCYCRDELDRLLDLVGPRHIIEVALPREAEPHRKYPVLAQSHCVESQDPDEILRDVCAHLGVSPPERPRPREDRYRDRMDGFWDRARSHNGTRGQPKMYEGVLLGRPYEIALNGWVQEQIDGLPQFKYAVEWPRLRVNVSVGEEVEVPRREKVTGDRAVYDFLLQYAPRHLLGVGRLYGEKNVMIHGVHLLIREELSDMGLTYFAYGYWTRKISLILYNKAARPSAPAPLGSPQGSLTGATGEFVFTFGLRGSFQEYCLMTRPMDELALSLTWA